MRKFMSMLLASAMVLSMSLTSVAAKVKTPVLKVDDEHLTIITEDKTASYDMKKSEIFLKKSSDNGITIQFRDKKNVKKQITLGSERNLIIEGDLDHLVLPSIFDKNYKITIAEDAEVERLDTNGKAIVYVEGELEKAYLNTPSAYVKVKEDGEIEKVYAKDKRSIKSESSDGVREFRSTGS